MIISHKHKFIFIKTRKTAGTSIEAFLSTYCEDLDVVSILQPAEDELTRRRIGGFPMNCLNEKFNIPNEKDMQFETAEEIKKFRRKHRYQHFSSNFDKFRMNFGSECIARSVREKVGKACWKEYYVFCFDRNPWERVMSLFYFAKKNRSIDYATDQQVREFILGKVNKGIALCNSRSYLDRKENIIVDKVFDYASMNAAMEDVCSRFGFDFEKFKSLPRFKGQHRVDKRPYEDFLSKETIDLIGDVHKNAIKLLGYVPNPSKI